MITIKEAPDQKFVTKQEVIKYLKENKSELMSFKKNTLVKYTDQVSVKSEIVGKSNATKEESNNDSSDLKVKIVLNTTNYLDSHGDVHINGIWKRTLKQANIFYHLQEHKNDFDKVISTDIKAYVEEMPFSKLGVKSNLKTEALIFESVIKKDRNPEMYKQYKNGWVNNHSVGMSYVDIELAIYDEDDEKEMDFWNKYVSEIANKEDAENQGYFWVVKEAKLREGSAVLFGSNPITPTLEVEENKSHPLKDIDESEAVDPITVTQPQIMSPNLI
jgi:hypothetical protein